MLDGLVGVVSAFKLDKKPIYRRHEWMLDVEKTALYYPDTSIWTILTYFDPRRDQEHKHPKQTYVHRLSGQFENFLFSQLSLSQIEIRELEALTDLLQMNPSTCLFDFVLGWWDSQAWRSTFPFFGENVFESWKAPSNAQTDDLVFLQGKAKIAKYCWRGLDIKFYRMNPEVNRNHMLKYPFGWAGYTKAEIVTPKFGDYRYPLAEKDHMTIYSILEQLQKLRQSLLREKWLDIQHEVTQKTYARNDRLYCWSSTETTLQGSMTQIETELTQRQKQSPQAYLQTLEDMIQ